MTAVGVSDTNSDDDLDVEGGLLVVPEVKHRTFDHGRSIISSLLDNHRGHNPMVLPYERLYDGSDTNPSDGDQMEEVGDTHM